MKPLNIIILGLGGFFLYQWYQKNKSTLTNNPLMSVTQMLPPGVSVSVPETTGVAQIVPTPSTIMPLNVALGFPPVETGACNCCNKISGISKRHFII